MREGLKTLWLVVSTAVRVSPVQSALCVGETVGVLLRLLQPLFLSWLIAGVIEHALEPIVAGAAAFVGSQVLHKVLGFVGVNARIGQLERVGYAFGKRIAETTASIPTLDHLESPLYVDQLQTIRDQDWSLGLALNMLLNSVNGLVLAGGTIALATTADWRLLLVAVAGAPAVLAARWFVRWQRQAEDRSAQPGRLANHLLELGLSPVSGAELRVFGLTRPVRARLRRAATDWRAPFVRTARRRAAVESATTILFFGVAILVLGWMIRDLIAGVTELQAVVLAFLLVGRLQSIGGTLQGTIWNLSQVIRTTSRIRWLFAYEREVAALHRGTATPVGRLTDGIVVEDLGYSYPDAESPALQGISLRLPAGSVVALVGENGAGKSTLVKLLAGLYRPGSGRILVDGVPLTELDLTQWRERVSGAFQDYAKFEALTRQAIGLGWLPELDNLERVRTAVRAGAAEGVVASLPAGLETQLGPTWPGGVDLSGGQWQRIALARGLMRAGPLLLVLDEPTSALDAHTEHALFERYAEAARQGRQAGTVTLLVTHRFSTVAAADRIVVLDGGRIVEEGSHAELVRRGGRYAELYELQARGYR